MYKGDLEASQRRLAQRAQEASEKALRKLERDKILAERKKAREEALEREKEARRKTLLAKEEEEREELERLQEQNKGVVYRGTLQAVPAPREMAAEKGIRRCQDKILLPPSVGSLLMDQKAYKNGPYFFELENNMGRITHAGLLDFASAEGFVGLPTKVVRCLWGPDADEGDVSGPIKVTYKRLCKGESAEFQPRDADFQSTVDEHVREVLEGVLLEHSCLTVGDWISVSFQDRSFDLRVRNLEPSQAVSVIDTDLDAEIHPSIETEEKILAEEMAARRAMEERLRAEKEAEKIEQEQLEERQRRLEEHEKIKFEKSSTLPPEPSDEDVDIKQSSMKLLVRFPNGEKHARRFLMTDNLGTVFHFVDAMGASGYFPGEYRLVTQYPRAVLSSDADTMLESIGHFSPGKSQVLFLEPKPGDTSQNDASVL